MNRSCQRWMWGCCLVAATAAGCASTASGIPIGRWSGQGCYVDYAGPPGADPTTAAVQEGAYETSLMITEQDLFGTPALVFEIRSKRGQLMNVPDAETHLEVALVELRTLPSGACLYAVAPRFYNTPEEPWDESQFRQDVKPVQATCTRAGGKTVLQVDYGPPSEAFAIWTDTFVFDGDRVLKSGRIVGMADGAESDGPAWQVYWTEELRRTR